VQSQVKKGEAKAVVTVEVGGNSIGCQWDPITFLTLINNYYIQMFIVD
jgi:hypothetical protein